MTENQNQPREYDAVKGGESQVPLGAAVLGGISGVKSRLASPIVEVKIAALSEALKYGDAGLDLIIGALQNESMQVKLAAYSLLKDRDDLKLQPHFPQDYLPTFDFDVITVDAEGKENSRSRHYARFFPEDLGNGVMLEMVYIPGGTFMMGSPATEEDGVMLEMVYIPGGTFMMGSPAPEDSFESPQHQVTVPAFFAGKYPITQAQWQAVMGNNPSCLKGEKLPVAGVSWQDAVEFCGKLSQKTGKKYRLLSEAEWEYACRAGTTTPFHFGETITPELVNYVHYDGSSPYATAPKILYPEQTSDVGIFPPNVFGLYDMHAQVWEWCRDRWHSNYNGAPTDGSSWETGTDNKRVLRGGSWDEYVVLCRCAYRYSKSADSRCTKWGFRVAVASVSSSS
ncbi:formylglycine-generating enzyme family protein [Microcoleus vaginatus]|uniref:formylglycine-generating enzyme family protein n=1 Tax=Microcoleus vaginatus TaxID=119532 RepID=UPI001F608CC5|nr:formylglycine-generating enzyme family protein [Microcoleus vaginatus HSN003]